ncbi:flagellar basal body protein, partial [Salmonella enterica subsp. enterica serovar Montevideo]|nr:flagellar basal body protein [Salmonella enterica subsp. enterica serovar Montevideo]
MRPRQSSATGDSRCRSRHQGSALAAQSKRLNVAASNLANADSVTGPDGQPYRAKQVVFQVD